jgi:methionyl-tRNA formyltransferase
MRVAFAGTPAFAATALAALLDGGFDVCMVLCQPDRPAGRGQQVLPGPVKRLALDRALPVLTPASLRPERGGVATEQALAQLRAAAPDVLVVAAYGLLLPEAVLQLPRGLPLADGRIGAVNIHASLLPRWRGAAPIVRAIEAGDTRTGITIMQMEAGLDTGPILLAEGFDIDPAVSAGELTLRLARLGGELVVRALRELALGRLQARVQPADGVTYANKVEKREAWIDWRLPAARIAARIRAFDPFPGACSSIDGHTIKIWAAQQLPEPQAPAGATAGAVLAAGPEGIVVACGHGCLRLTQLQRAGGRRLGAREFLAGTPLAVGSVWTGSDPKAAHSAHDR